MGKLPIRKISSTKVGLSSYYGKLFVKKADRAVFNADRWILNNISARGMDAEDNSIMNLALYKSFKFDQKLPSIYSLLSTQFSGFETQEYEFHTNYDKRDKYFTADEMARCEAEGKTVLIGRKKNGTPIIVDYSNVFYECTNDQQIALGTIEDMIGVEHEKRPVEILEVDVFGKPIPLGMVLGYHVGFDELIKLLKPSIRRVKRVGRTPLNLDKNEFAIVFEDEAVIFEKGNKMVEYVFGGFNRWPKDIGRYNIGVFNKPQVYEAIFDRNGLGARYPRELRLLFTSFIDPITREVLKSMGEPEELFTLFLRAAELLMTMDYPAASDMTVMRDKGYERVSGFIYSELMKSMRVFKSKTSPMAKFEINPSSVWLNIIQDSSNALVEDSNPIANMKEQEIVVFGGQGGRGQRSLQGNHRAFHKSQIGSTSEATKDSGKVATIVYTTADPKYTSLRGTVAQYDPQTDGPARLISPSFMLAPVGDRDD